MYRSDNVTLSNVTITNSSWNGGIMAVGSQYVKMYNVTSFGNAGVGFGVSYATWPTIVAPEYFYIYSSNMSNNTGSGAGGLGGFIYDSHFDNNGADGVNGADVYVLVNSTANGNRGSGFVVNAARLSSYWEMFNVSEGGEMRLSLVFFDAANATVGQQHYLTKGQSMVPAPSFRVARWSLGFLGTCLCGMSLAAAPAEPHRSSRRARVMPRS
jgi:hypothetical protein